MSRKRRSDSKLGGLNPEQKKAIRSWLVDDNLSYKDTKKRIATEFGVKTSDGALSHFYATECFALRFQKSTEFADALDLPPEKFDDKMIKALKQLAFELSLSKEPNLGALKTLFKLLGDSAKIQIAKDRVGLDARKVQLLEAKAVLAEKTEGILGDKTLTEEEQAAQVRALFGMG